MAKYTIELAMLVRRVRTVVVDVPNDMDMNLEFNNIARNIYHQEDEDDAEKYTEDGQWDCEEGTHHLIGFAAKELEFDKPDFVVTFDEDEACTWTVKKAEK